jgi:hypothetical protein
MDNHMRTILNNERVPNAQVLKELKIGRTTLHEYRKKLGIDGVRERGKVYILRQDVERLKAYIKSGVVDCEVRKPGKELNSTEHGSRTSSESSNIFGERSEQSEQPGTSHEQGTATSGQFSKQEAYQTVGDQNKAMEEELRRQIADLKSEIIKKEKKVELQEKQLIHGALEIGMWRGKAQTYEEELRLLQGPKSSTSPSEDVTYAKESGWKQPFNGAGEGSKTVYAEVVDKECDAEPVVVEQEHDNFSDFEAAQKKTPQNEKKREREKRREKEKRENEEEIICLNIYDVQPVPSKKWWEIWSRLAA